MYRFPAGGKRLSCSSGGQDTLCLPLSVPFSAYWEFFHRGKLTGGEGDDVHQRISRVKNDRSYSLFPSLYLRCAYVITLLSPLCTVIKTVTTMFKLRQRVLECDFKSSFRMYSNYMNELLITSTRCYLIYEVVLRYCILTIYAIIFQERKVYVCL